MIRKIAVVVLSVVVVALIVIQFFHQPKNQSTEIIATDITKVTTVPDSVLQVLKVSCYDCHSNNTNYPWYNNIQPVAWWLNSHVEEGKKHLNFSDFGSYTAEKKAKKMKGIVKEIDKNDMPLTSFTLIHRDAVLTDAQKVMVKDWAKNAQF